MSEERTLPATRQVFDYDHGVKVDEPRFPEPYLGLYRQWVRAMEAEVIVLPGMHTAMSLLIRQIARDQVAQLMVDRQESFGAEMRCGNCLHVTYHPWWPEKDRRQHTAFQRLFDAAKSKDVEGAVRREFVLGLIEVLMGAIDDHVEQGAQRTLLKEELRGRFLGYLDSDKTRRRL